MRRVSWLWLVLTLGMLACNLTASEDAEPTAIPLIVSSLTPTSATATPRLNLTPSPTTQINPTPTTSLPSTNPNTSAPLPANCTPRTDWGTYTVQNGDTLGGLAAARGTTVNALTTGNCLANPDSLAVGQVLRLPATTTGNPTTGNNTTSTGNNTTSTGNNTTNTGTGNNTTGNTTTGSGNNTTTNPSSSAPRFAAGLAIRPVVQAAGIGAISLQQTIALDAGVVAEADRVEYYAGLSLTDSSPVMVGSDTDPFDGTQITYDFNDFDERLFFWAVAVNEFGSTKGEAVSVVYDPSYDPNASASVTAVSISPTIGFDGSIYTLQYDATVTVSWSSNSANGATKVDFYLDNQLIGTDTNPSDGISLSWVVPQWVLGQVKARASFTNGGTQDSLALYVYSEGIGVRPSN